MSRYYYDLHSHSCLSPCADNGNTPHDLAGMGVLAGLQIMALTDHNTCRNCPAFCRAAEALGLIPVPGMELTTAEDVHMVCLFPSLEAALAFDAAVDARRVRVRNRPEIFGEQQIMDENDVLLGIEPDLLSNATTVTVEESVLLAAAYDGVCYPAHIDREANGIIAVLGTLPESPRFPCAELHDATRETALRAAHPALAGLPLIVGSDAHCLWDVRDAAQALELAAPPEDPVAVRHELIRWLRGERG